MGDNCGRNIREDVSTDKSTYDAISRGKNQHKHKIYRPAMFHVCVFAMFEKCVRSPVSVYVAYSCELRKKRRLISKIQI